MKARIYGRTVEMTEDVSLSGKSVHYNASLTNEEYEKLTGYKVKKNYSPSFSAYFNNAGKICCYAQTGSQFGGTHGTFKTLKEQEGVIEVIREEEKS